MASQRTVFPNCDMCDEEYDTLKRIPVFLRCYHTFCLLCLQSEKIKDAAVKCRTCHALTTVDLQIEYMGLEMNEKIMAHLKQPKSSSAKSPDAEIQKERYFWCLDCNLTVQEETDCVKIHMTVDLETDKGKEKADSHFRMLLGTYKNQLSGHLTKHRETDLALEAIQSALKALNLQASLRKKENDRQIKKLQKELLLVNNLLGKSPEEMHVNGEDVYKSDQELRDLVKKASVMKTTDFDQIRNYVISMDIKSQDKLQLMTPLSHSDLIINFPSVGATELESHLLTTLSFLVLVSIQKGDWIPPVRPRKVSETLKKQFQKKTFEKNWADEKQEATGKEFEPKKPIRTITRSPSDLGTRPKLSVYSKADHPRYYPNPHAYPNEQQKHIRPHRQEASNEAAATKWKPTRVAFQENYQVPAPVSIPSLMSRQSRKAILSLAVNGKPYGNIIIELRPDVAPVMCQKFLERCGVKDGPSYQGTIIYQSKAKTFIMGGKIPGPESLYMADVSPLRKTRGAIFFRLKRDYVKTQCSIVSTDFCIHLGDESPDNHRTSTVFGYVCDGLAVCDAISYMDCCNRDHVAISSVGLVD